MADDTTIPQEPEQDIELLKSQLAQSEAMLTQMTDTCRRALADLSNYKKFTEDQRKQASWYGTAEIIKDMLPIIDNFDRARQHVKDEGIEAIYRQLTAILQKHRVEKIETIGKPFNATQHEVLSQGPGPENQIIEEFEKGYTIAGQVLRPAKVIVGNGQKEVE